jgi:hypothetical protein
MGEESLRWRSAEYNSLKELAEASTTIGVAASASTDESGASAPSRISIVTRPALHGHPACVQAAQYRPFAVIDEAGKFWSGPRPCHGRTRVPWSSHPRVNDGNRDIFKMLGIACCQAGMVGKRDSGNHGVA